MKTYTTSQDQNFTIDHADYLAAGHGLKIIRVSVTYNDEFIDNQAKEFSAVTDNMPGFDDATDLSGQEMYEALFELVESKLDSKISEWIYEITE